MAKETEIYVSTDIEADGPIPGPHSMLSVGSAAFLPDKTIVSRFSANLEALPGATEDARTMEWWKGFPQAWEECRRVMRRAAAVCRRRVPSAPIDWPGRRPDSRR